MKLQAGGTRRGPQLGGAVHPSARTGFPSCVTTLIAGSATRGRIWFLLAAVLMGWPPASHAQTSAAADSTCAGCHDVGEKVKKSGHAQVGCSKCHLKHDEYPHPANVPKPVCVSCHAPQVGDHATSVHGQELKKGNAAAPNCDSCHGTAHELLPARTAEFKKGIPATCGTCHNDVQSQFDQSVHGKAVARGIMDAPVCTDCHGEHNIQRPKESASLVNAGHLRETCGRCHGDLRLARQFGLPSDRLTSFDASFQGVASLMGYRPRK